MFEAVPSCSGGKVFKNCQHQVNLNYLASYLYFSCVGNLSFQIHNEEREYKRSC